MATKKTLPFRTLLDDPVKIYTEAGSEIEDVMALRLNEKGEEEFYISGKTNVQEKIDAAAVGTTVHEIIEKVMATGDVTILQQKKCEFVDLTTMPENIFEAQQKITEAEKTFRELPLAIREAYNHNFNEYLADVGSDKWLEIVGLKEKPVEPAKEEPEKGETE